MTACLPAWRNDRAVWRMSGWVRAAAAVTMANHVEIARRMQAFSHTLCTSEHYCCCYLHSARERGIVTINVSFFLCLRISSKKVHWVIGSSGLRIYTWSAFVRSQCNYNQELADRWIMISKSSYTLSHLFRRRKSFRFFSARNSLWRLRNTLQLIKSSYISN